jgi:hypothetical protein
MRVASEQRNLKAGPSRGQACTRLAGAFETLQRLKQCHELAVVTSRQFAIQQATLEWLEQHFPSTFDSVHFGNHFAKAGDSRKKSEICRDIGADVLIDDNPAYAFDCACADMHVLLFNWNLGYPWAEQPEECASLTTRIDRARLMSDGLCGQSPLVCRAARCLQSRAATLCPSRPCSVQCARGTAWAARPRETCQCT